MAIPAFIQNINPTELMLIAVVAVLVFGRRLPQVAGQTMAHVQKARRAFNDLRRETGIDDELRDARRTFEQASYEAKRDPAAPKIRPPQGGAVGRERVAEPDPAAPDVDEAQPSTGTPDDGSTGDSGPPRSDASA